MQITISFVRMFVITPIAHRRTYPNIMQYKLKIIFHFRICILKKNYNFHNFGYQKTCRMFTKKVFFPPIMFNIFHLSHPQHWAATEVGIYQRKQKSKKTRSRPRKRPRRRPRKKRHL